MIVALLLALVVGRARPIDLRRSRPQRSDGDFFEMDDRFNINDGGSRANSRGGYRRYPEDQEEYRWYFNLRRDEDGDNYENLIDLARVFDPGDTSDSQFDQLIVVSFVASSQTDKRRDRLARQLVLAPNHRSLGDCRVRHQRRLHLHCGDVVAGDQHHIVDPTEQPQVAVFVDLGAISRKVHTVEA